VFYNALAFNGDLSAWNVGNVQYMVVSACGPASIPPPTALVVCTRAGGCHSPPHSREFNLRPQPPSAASGGGEAWGRLASAGVRLSHRGARTPDHKIVRQRCHGRAAVRPLRAFVGRGVPARSVWQRPRPVQVLPRPVQARVRLLRRGLLPPERQAVRLSHWKQTGICASTCIASTPPAYTRTTVFPGSLMK
jgi:hypothetical protein